MSNGTFPISMRDMKFILYEWLGIERLCTFDKFKDYSRETFDMVLDQAAQLAAEVIAPLNFHVVRSGGSAARTGRPRGFLGVIRDGQGG